MTDPLRRGATALAALGTLALVGCAGPAGSTDRTPGAVLQAANQQALSSSFKADFTAQLAVNLSRVTPAAGMSAGALGLIQAEINNLQLRGVLEVQSPKLFEMSFTLSPLLTQAVHLIDVNGTEYISENGTQWHSQPSTAAGGAGKLSGGLSNLKSQVDGLGQSLRGEATVKDLGRTGSGSDQVEHIQTSLTGADLNRSWASILSTITSDLGAQGGSLSAELPTIERLVQFTQVTSDSFVLTASGQLARIDTTVGMTLDLSQLAVLAPGQSGLPTGSAGLTLTVRGSFSGYGSNFNIQKPSDLVPGPLPTPSGLAGALTQA
ncbi:MAG TPA: hypothetical protein VNH20_04070 [Candidatus Dormibacteraeota bacterium]|nr:hypothetical protein [Candidatus Dormibacteraeota bacterium]